jgi:hypothetical protein
MSWSGIAHAMIHGHSDEPKYEVRLDPDGKYRRYYRLDSDEWISPVACVTDDRNVHGLVESSLRARLDKGETDPERLFWDPLAWRNRAKVAA